MMRDAGPIPQHTLVRPTGLGHWYAIDEATGAPLVVLVFEVDGLDRPIGITMEPDEAALLAMAARDRAEKVWQSRDAAGKP